MKLEELFEGRDWTVLSLIDAIKSVKNEVPNADVTIGQNEVVFEVPAGEDIAPKVKTHMKPFIIKTQYKRDGDTHEYHYHLTRQMVQAEVTRAKRAIA